MVTIGMLMILVGIQMATDLETGMLSVMRMEMGIPLEIRMVALMEMGIHIAMGTPMGIQM
jgi:hypothetical protein